MEFVYDHGGQRIAKVVDPQGVNRAVTRYYGGGLLESDGPWATKYYFAGGMLIASNRTWAPALAGIPADPAIQVAQSSAAQPELVLMVRNDWQLPLALSVALLGSGLLLAPWRRKAVVGVRLRHGQILLVAVVFGATTLPISFMVQPVSAGGTGPMNTPTNPPAPASTPTRTPTPTRTATPPGAVSGVQHYHLDHLGSVQAISDNSGQILKYVRYKPYGAIRDSFDSTGSPLSGSLGSDAYAKSFTGYENEPITGLQYAGARIYDPILGQFLTHDPAREFANPYNYVNWDPINAADPSGACLFFCLLIIGFIVGFTASAIQAGVQGASLGQALKAGAIGGAIGAAGAVIGAILQPMAQGVLQSLVKTVGVSAQTAATTAQAIMLGGSLAQAGHGLSQGDYTGIIGLGLSIGIGWSMNRGTEPRGSSGVSEETLGDIAAHGAEFGMKMTDSNGVPLGGPKTLSQGQLLYTEEGAVANMTGHTAGVTSLDGTSIDLYSSNHNGQSILPYQQEGGGGRWFEVYNTGANADQL